MKEIFFKCTLVSDIVLNSKLATEGNMTTLDYIPGSNFLGIVASKLYETLNPDDAFSIFHSGDVSFGDAIISENNEIFYQLPFDLMMVKGKDTLCENEVYLQHILSKLNNSKLPKDENGFKAQLKQKRNGYVSSSSKVISKIKKTFALKSAQDANERRSKEGAMFGFESLKKGQEFVFSVQFKNEEFIGQVTDSLIGRKRLGKSKTAEFGQVEIEMIKDTPQKIAGFQDATYSLVYAQSNLCFFDKIYKQPTYQPKVNQLDLNGEICWKKSQIRTYSYAPWNGTRNTTDTQRNCILAGSVFYIKGGNEAGEKSVGEFQAEGLGRIIVNPVFLKGNEENGKSHFFNNLNNQNEAKQSPDSEPLNTSLGGFLKKRYDQKKAELELSRAIQDAFEDSIGKSKDKNQKPKFNKVSSSQWGAIRSYATRETNIDQLKKALFSKETGYLTHGVAYERIWGKRNEEAINELKAIFNIAEKSFAPTSFIAKFAAEMAKYEQNKLKNKAKKEVEHAK